MGRWRPPQPDTTAIISAAGYQQLKRELDQLWREERPQVTAQVQAAAKNGDRSENGDYIYGKRRLAEIDRRVRYLQRRLDGIRVVSQPPQDTRNVYFGACVTLTDADGQSLMVQILGPDEIDSQQARISIDSPLARALLGKSVGQEVSVEAPGGKKWWIIQKIHYAKAGFTASNEGQ